jgi:tetratricopeptide (TPR) repeat protein
MMMRAKYLKACFPALVVLTIGCTQPMTSTASEISPELQARIDSCSRSWESLLQKYSDDRARLKMEWQGLNGKCKGTGIYEYRWAALLERTGDRQGAISFLAASLKQDLPFKDELEVSYLGYQFSELILAEKPDADRLRKIRERSEELLRKYPVSVSVMEETAFQRLYFKDFAGAIDVARRAVNLDEKSWLARRVLVMAAARSGDYPIGKPYIRPAIELRESLLADKDFMYAATACYLETGDVLTAEKVLLALYERVPDVKQDSQYQRLAGLVVAAKRKAEQHSTNSESLK